MKPFFVGHLRLSFQFRLKSVNRAFDWHTWKASASMTNEELASFEADIRVLGEQILATTIEDHSPSLKLLCDECDFLQLCKKDPRYA